MRLLIQNIGAILTGDVATPRADGRAVLIEDGLVADIGPSLGTVNVDLMIDANGMTVAPGLIDLHAHPVVGDWHPRQQTTGWIESGMHSGVTSIMSAGPVHLPGRPTSPDGLVAMAIVVAESYRRFRPGRVKVQADVLMPTPGLTDEHFAFAARAGVSTYGEVGYGEMSLAEAVSQAEQARAAGMRLIMHCGGASHVGERKAALSTRFEDIVRVRPDIVSHLNGGTTAIPAEEAVRIVTETDMPFDIVAIGNPRVAALAMSAARDSGQLFRVMFGTDAPAGFGMIPAGIMRLVVEAASLHGVDADVAWACASGNAARIWALRQGVLAPGRPADLLLLDAPTGSEAHDALGALATGDLPHIACVLVDGEIAACPSRNAPSGKRDIKLNGSRA